MGEQVLLKLQPYTQSSLVNRPCPKLALNFFGPLRILERFGEVAYKLDLPSYNAINQVFHVSQLKTYTPDFTPVFADLSCMPELDTADTRPEKIFDRRLVKKGNAAVPQVLVKWAGIPATSATWEDYYVCKNKFPDSIAWGQAISPAAGDVTTASSPGTQSG